MTAPESQRSRRGHVRHEGPVAGLAADAARAAYLAV